MWIFITLFVVFGVAYVILAQKQEQKVRDGFSQRPDLTKRHAVMESVVVRATPEAIWPYFTDVELMKKWRPALRGAVVKQGTAFQLGSMMLFDYSDGAEANIRAEVIAVEQHKHIAFRIHHHRFGFYRYEWLLLEAMDAGTTKVSIVADHQHRTMVNMMSLKVWMLNSLSALYRRAIQGELVMLQSLFT